MAVQRVNYDVLSMIMSWAEHQTLLACCLVSKDYQTASTPFLYSEVKLGWFSDHDPTPFLTDLVGNPRLARLVRTLSTGLIDRADASTNPQSVGNTFDPLPALGAFYNLRFLSLSVTGVVDIQPTTDAIASLSHLHSLDIYTDEPKFMDCLLGRLSLCRPLRYLVVQDNSDRTDDIYLDSLVKLLCRSSTTLRRCQPIISDLHETALCAKLRTTSVIWEHVHYLFWTTYSMMMVTLFPNIFALHTWVSSELFEILAQPALLPNLQVLDLLHLDYNLTPTKRDMRPVSQLTIGHGAFYQEGLEDYASTEACSVVRCMQLLQPSALRSIKWDSIYPHALPLYAAALARFSALEYLELYILTQFDGLLCDETFIIEKEENYLICLELALQHLLEKSLPVSLRYILIRRGASSEDDLRVNPGSEHIAAIGDVLCSSAGEGRHPGLHIVQIYVDSEHFTWRRSTAIAPGAASTPWSYLGDSSATPVEPEVDEIAGWIDRQPHARCFIH